MADPADLEPDWPEADKAEPELNKILFNARVTEVAELRRSNYDDGRTPSDVAVDQADVDAEHALDQVFQQSMYDVAKGSVDRAHAAADLTQKAAAAIGTIYTGVLALAFSVTSNPLPPRGLIAPLFLGAAVVLATGYTAYITHGNSLPGPSLGPSVKERQRQRLLFFLTWVFEGVLRRANWLRAAVLSLGFGVLFLPAAFIHVGSSGGPAPSTINWPAPPTNVANEELAKILYQAQVTKAAATEPAVAPVRKREELPSWLAAGAAALLVVGTFRRSDEKKKTPSKKGSVPPLPENAPFPDTPLPPSEEESLPSSRNE